MIQESRAANQSFLSSASVWGILVSDFLHRLSFESAIGTKLEMLGIRALRQKKKPATSGGLRLVRDLN